MCKIKILLVTLMLMVVHMSCMAMTMKNPVQIGKIRFDLNRDTGFTFDGFSEINGYKHYSKVRKAYTNGYGKGTVLFNYDGEKLYVDYNIPERWNLCRIGEADNYIESDIIDGQLFKILTSEGNSLYAMFSSYTYTDFVVFGKNSNGKFVKYIDSKNINKDYFGNHGNNYESIESRGDTLVVKYRAFLKNKVEIGEFRFPWSESAQWFGIEKVIY